MLTAGILKQYRRNVARATTFSLRRLNALIYAVVCEHLHKIYAITHTLESNAFSSLLKHCTETTKLKLLSSEVAHPMSVNDHA